MSAPPDLSQWDHLSDEELETIAAGGDGDDFADYSDEELEAIAAGKDAPVERTPIEAATEAGRGRLEGGVSPEEFLGLPEVQRDLRENGPARLRTFLETVAGVGSAFIPGLQPVAGATLGPRLGMLAARAGVAGLASGGASLASESFDPTEGGAPEAIRRAARTGAYGAAGEVGGSAVGGILGAIVRKLRGGIFPVTDPSRRVAQEAIEAGGGVLPVAQASGSNAARIAQGLGESSILGSGAIQRAREGAQEIATDAVTKFVEKLPQRHGREELGTVIQEALEGRSRAFLASAEDAYGAVDDAFDAAIQRKVAESGAVVPRGTKVTAQPTVSLASVKASARELLRRAQDGLPGGEVQRVLQGVIEKPDIVTFRAAQRLRSDLLRVTRSSTELIAGQARAASKRMSGLVDDAMESSARQAGPEVEAAWRAANEGYKAGAQTFNSKLVRELGRRQPEAVLEAITKANRPGSVKLARKAIGDAKVWESVQREYLNRLVTVDAIDAGGEVLKGQKLLTKLRQHGETAKELLGKERHDELLKLARTLEITQEFTGKGAGGINIRGAPEGVAIGLAASGRMASAARIVLAPAFLAKAFTDPKIVRLLTRGIKVPQGSPEAARVFGQLTQLLARDDRPRDPAERALDRSPLGFGSATFGGPR